MHADPTAGLETLHDCRESISNELFSDIQNPAHRLHRLLPRPLTQCPVNLRRQHTLTVQPPHSKRVRQSFIFHHEMNHF